MEKDHKARAQNPALVSRENTQKNTKGLCEAKIHTEPLIINHVNSWNLLIITIFAEAIT
jgi:hypothetical protein